MSMVSRPAVLAERFPIAVRAECPEVGSDDLRLVTEAAAGDEVAFDRIVALHRDRVAGLAYRLLGWPDDVDDVVQDVFLAAYTGLRRFRGDCSVATWLTTITVNKCRTQRRRRLLWWKRTSSADAKDHAALGPAADRRMSGRETDAKVRRAVTALPVRYREVVVLRYLEELSIERIGDVLRISRNAVQIRLHRARGQLKDALRGLVEE